MRIQNAQGCEDWDLNLRIAERYEFQMVPEFLIGYRKASNSMSGNYRSMAKSVTGLMLPAELETAAQVAFHRGTSGFNWECRPIIYDTEYFENRKPFGTPVWQIGAGANMSVTASANC